MLLPRVIPCLLLSGKGLVKGQKFHNHVYVGDPINALQLFNTKEADEILFLDIAATKERRLPDLELVQMIADQVLMPFSVGGGISSLEDAKKILRNGAEKICLNTRAIENYDLLTQIADAFGRQSVILSIDVKKSLWGKKTVYTNCGTKNTGKSPVDCAVAGAKAGAGEILLNSIDHDGMMTGYDLDLIKEITAAVNIPVIASGGAWTKEHLKDAIVIGRADAVAAGSMFVFHGKRRGVLISYPQTDELRFIRGPDS